jgi:hypothetical protein
MSYEDDCNEYYFGIPFKKRVSVEATAAASPAKFKIGDRVTTGGVDDAGVGVVLGNDDRSGDHWLVKFDTWYGNCSEHEDQLSLAPTIAIGDRVKLKRHFGPHAVGDAGKVRELYTKAGFVNAGVDMESGIYSMFPVEALEAVAADCAVRKEQRGYVTGISSVPGQPAIVARVIDGQPRPSNIPYMHASSADALLEAERLAKNNPGQEFAVYQRVGARVASVEYNMKEVA